MYKDLHSPVYAHNRKAKDALELDGWMDNRMNMPHQQYPRMMYGPNGQQVAVGNYDKEGKVNLTLAKLEEASYLEAGYSLTPIAVPEPVAEEKPVIAPYQPPTETRQVALEAQVKQLSEMLAAALAAKSEPKPFGMGRRRSRKTEAVNA